MKCSHAKELIALYAGGDLEGKEAIMLEDHLIGCSSCRKYMEEMKASVITSKSIMKEDIPEPLPDDFARNLSCIIARDSGEAGKAKYDRQRTPLWRVAIAAGGWCAAIVLAVLLVINPMREKDIQDSLNLDDFSLKLNGEVYRWSELGGVLSGEISGPFKLSEWNPEGIPSVIAVIARLDDDAGSHFEVLYCDDLANPSLIRYYPWLEDRRNRLLSSVKSPDDLFVVVFSMPDSSRRDRDKVENAIIRGYNPRLNVKEGV